ncbi:restriction endonuclease [Cellulomonas sp. NTE-D12]|uniref:McrC family protein n=1 Tax=Cellulomonas sp. NTE-D12 TaxID=2962632 RepID=UPI00308207F5|nr:McrBC 5-methylcytosine restriction system component [Cellulomonas sp. NTE-D12]
MHIDLTENGDPIEVEIPAAVGILLRASGLVTAAPSLEPGWWTVGPAGKVGVARVGSLEIWVAPKLVIRRLFFLMGYARDLRAWRDEDLGLREDADLVTAIATAFARQADRATQQGLLQGYRVEETSSPVVRGKIRTADQVRHRYGIAVPVEIRYDEYGVDIPENQLLRGAAAVLLQLGGLDLLTRKSLLRLVRATADVTPLRRGVPLPSWQPSRLNARYQLALHLAELVLRGGSVEQAPGSTQISGFMLDMAALYEDFLTVALGMSLTRAGGICRPQDRWHLDEADSVPMRPDLVWYAAGSSDPTAVVDAKYKAEKPSGFPNADLYQMLAYCSVMGLPRGHLVYAKGNEPATTHVFRRTGIEVTQHTLDLDQDPADLLAQVDHLATSIAVASAPAGPSPGSRSELAM